MKNKTLATLVFIGAIASFGCNYKIYYTLPDEEICESRELIIPNSLTITKKDGKIIKFNYVNIMKCPYMKSVEITENGRTSKYIQERVLEFAKGKVLDYYEKIQDEAIKKLE